MAISERKHEFISSTGAFCLSYVLLLVIVMYGADILPDSLITMYIWFSIVAIMLPTMIAKILSNYRVTFMIFSPIITFIGTLIYFPSGIYIIAPVGGLIKPSARSIDENLIIVGIMFIMQLIEFCFGSFVKYLIAEFINFKSK